jgi:hypothetical protein
MPKDDDVGRAENLILNLSEEELLLLKRLFLELYDRVIGGEARLYCKRGDYEHSNFMIRQGETSPNLPCEEAERIAAACPDKLVVMHTLKAQEMSDLLLGILKSRARLVAAGLAFRDPARDVEEKATLRPVVGSADPIAIGRRIDDLRKEARLSLKDLAKITKLTEKTIGRHIRGTVAIRQENLRAYAVAFSSALHRAIIADDLTKA